MSLLPQSETQPPTPAATGTMPQPQPDTVVPAEFPGFGDRLSRVWARFVGKPASFLTLGLLFSLSTAGGSLVPELLPQGSAYAPLLIRAGAGVPAAIFAMALGVSAAFKAGLGKALVVSLKRGVGIIGISLAMLMVLVLPTMLLVVPGIILCFRFMLAVPVFVVERRGGFEALTRSRDLVYGATRNIFLEWLVIGLLPALVVAGAQYGVAALAAGTGDSTASIAASAVGMILQTLTIPLLIIYLQVFYEDRVALDTADWVAHPRRSKLYAALGTAGFLTTIILGAFAGPAIAFIALYFGTKDLATKAPLVNVAVDAPRIPAPPEPQPAPEPEKKSTPEERDLERYGDVNTVKIALAEYYGEEKAYPASLAALAPRYVAEVPTDPVTGATYGYVRTGLSYKLSFALEAGVFALSKGEHFLTPNGFDVEPIQAPPPPPEGETVVTTIPPPEPTAPPEPTNPLPEEPTPPSGEEQAPPAPSDIDGDGLTDDDEVARGTSAAESDTDKDGLSDGKEVNVFKTDPVKADTDGDGYPDGDELYGGFDPNGPSRLPDLDGDGLADVYETDRGFDGGDRDMDNDGLSDGDELRVYRTDPQLADTDGDGFTDPQELQKGYEPAGDGPLTPERRAQIDADAKKYGLY